MSVPGPTVIEFFHSKLFSPTRRLCLGEVRLPADAGCLLVSRIAARFGAAVDRATAEEVRDSGRCSVGRAGRTNPGAATGSKPTELA